MQFTLRFEWRLKGAKHFVQWDCTRNYVRGNWSTVSAPRGWPLHQAANPEELTCRSSLSIWYKKIIESWVGLYSGKLTLGKEQIQVVPAVSLNVPIEIGGKDCHRNT